MDLNTSQTEMQTPLGGTPRPSSVASLKLDATPPLSQVIDDGLKLHRPVVQGNNINSSNNSSNNTSNHGSGHVSHGDGHVHIQQPTSSITEKKVHTPISRHPSVESIHTPVSVVFRRNEDPIRKRAKSLESTVEEYIFKPEKHDHSHDSWKKLAWLSLTALGIVFGDIGTSPLYVLKTVFESVPDSLLKDEDTKNDMVYGALSSLIYLMTLVTCFKYIFFVLQADKNGEGGIFALVSLLSNEKKQSAPKSKPAAKLTHLHNTTPAGGVKEGLTELEKGQIDQILSQLSDMKANSSDLDVKIPISPYHRSLSPRSPNRPRPKNLAEKLITRWNHKLFLIAIMGACFLIGDGITTPAISVLSALEGIQTVLPSFSYLVVPLSCVVLFLLFAIQRFGTGKVGVMFGPIMTVWFVSLGAVGVYRLMEAPRIFKVFNPYYIGLFFHKLRESEEPFKAFSMIANLSLSITGVEALYCDLGHFSKMPLRISWLGFAYPCLILHYLGQGAALLLIPEAVSDPFFLAAPEFSRVYFIILATLATSIASQAMISGCFQIVHQAIALDVFPKLQTIHTSKTNAGQIYIPFINWFLMIGSIILVVAFQHSSKLASIYGITVTGDMCLTSIFFVLIMYMTWKTKWYWILAYILVFWTIDFLLFTSSLVKIVTGGWVSIVLSIVLFTVMYVWYSGTKTMNEVINQEMWSLEEFVELLKPLPRVPGTGVFLSSMIEDVPSAMLFLTSRLNSLPSTVVVLSMVCLPVPHVPEEERVILKAIDEQNRMFRLLLQYGYHESELSPQDAIKMAITERGLPISDMEQVTYIIQKDTPIPDNNEMFLKRWRTTMYAAMLRNMENRVQQFRLPVENTLEVGIQVVM